MNNLVLIAIKPGADRQLACPWCLELAGWCDATGGPNPCEGYEEHVAAEHDYITAPTVGAPICTGGASC